MQQQGSESHCIIVADGEVLVRSALAEYLRHCGYSVIEAASSDEVMIVLEDGKIAVHAILSDAALGGALNAFELRMWVREHRPKLPMVLAGNLDAAVKAAGEMCDEGPHLKRPYDPQAVADYIKRLLAAARS